MNTKLKWLVALVALLMVANIALVAFIWLRKEEPQRPGRPRDARDYLVKSLEMNEEQVKRFDSLRKDHFERIKSYDDSLRFYKDHLFKSFKNPDSVNLGLTKDRIAAITVNRDAETFEHFSQLRSLLTVSQQNLFDSTIADVLRMTAPRSDFQPGHTPHRPGDGPPPPDGPPHMQ